MEQENAISIDNEHSSQISFRNYIWLVVRLGDDQRKNQRKEQTQSDQNWVGGRMHNIEKNDLETNRPAFSVTLCNVFSKVEIAFRKTHINECRKLSPKVVYKKKLCIKYEDYVILFNFR